MSEKRKLKLKSVGDLTHPHLIRVIDAVSDEPLSNVVRLDVSFRAGEHLAPGTMHHYKLQENGQLFLEGGETVIEQEKVDVVGLV